MKKLLFSVILCLIALPCFAQVFTGVYTGMVGGGASGAATGFCLGTELFCATFETDSQITWTSTPGTEDCDGYDTNGDWCDYDPNTPNPIAGSYGFGIRGLSTTIVSKALSSTTMEFYVEFTFQTNRSGSFDLLEIWDVTNNKYLLALYYSGTALTFYYDGASHVDSSSAMAANTTYHIGVYFKRATNATSTDGAITAWMNTDGSDFNSGDIIYGPTSNLDMNNAITAEQVYLVGPVTGSTAYYDNVKVVSGSTPASWGTP
jgi:hypothetical protein